MLIYIILIFDIPLHDQPALRELTRIKTSSFLGSQHGEALTPGPPKASIRNFRLILGAISNQTILRRSLCSYFSFSALPTRLFTMWRIAYRAAGPSHSPTVGIHRLHGYHRRFTLISIHSSFPASLLRLQSQPESTLLESSKSRKDMNPDEEVLVSDDGLVYPRLSMECPCQSTHTTLRSSL